LLSNTRDPKLEQNRFNYENPASDGSDRTLDRESWKEPQASLANANALQLGRVLGGRYQLLEVLGEGGMSAVFLSRHRELDQLVAIKVLRFDRSAGNDALKRFLQEAKATFQLNHPNLIRLLDFSSAEEDFPYLVMEYVAGKTLAELLKEKGRLEVKDVVDIFCQVCDGLAYAHSRRIVHRDLKPSNIMLATEADGTRVAKIVDFGIAKMTHSDNEQHLTKTGEIFGSPFYMSPEQCRGLSPDHRSDLYSIGCAMFECLSGSVPYCGENSMRTLFMHIEEPVPTLRLPRYKSFSAARALEEVVEQLLQKDPANRFQSASELKKSLLACIEPADRPPVESAEVLRKPISNSPLISAPPHEVPVGSGLNKKIVVITTGIVLLAVVIGGSAFSLYGSKSGSSHGVALPVPNKSGSSEGGGQPEKASKEIDPKSQQLQQVKNLLKRTEQQLQQETKNREAAEKALSEKPAIGKDSRVKPAREKKDNRKADTGNKRNAKEKEAVRQAQSKVVDTIKSDLARVQEFKKNNDLDQAEKLCAQVVRVADGIDPNNPIVRSAHFTYLTILTARPERARKYDLIADNAGKVKDMMSVRPMMNNAQKESVYGWLAQAYKTDRPDEAIMFFSQAAASAAEEHSPQGDVRFAGWESGKLHAMAHTHHMADALRACAELEFVAQNKKKPPLALFILQTTEASLYLEARRAAQARDALLRALNTLRRNHLEDHKHEYDRFADLCKKLKTPSR
jgi:serine/threonine-protein kinase